MCPLEFCLVGSKDISPFTALNYIIFRPHPHGFNVQEHSSFIILIENKFYCESSMSYDIVEGPAFVRVATKVCPFNL